MPTKCQALFWCGNEELTVNKIEEKKKQNSALLTLLAMFIYISLLLVFFM